MSTVAPPARRTRSADTRTLERVVAAVLMPLGPLCAAVIRFVIPGEPVGESVPADPGAQRLVLALGVVIVFTMVPGAYAALRLLRRKAPRLTAWTGAFLIPGYLAMMGGGMDAATMASYDAGFSPAEMDRLNAAIWALPFTIVIGLIFVVGHIVGTVLLGATMIATRATVLPVGIAMVVSQPLHLAAVITNTRWLDLGAWGLTALGMAFLAWRVLRTPNDEWDLPPLDRSPGLRA